MNLTPLSSRRPLPSSRSIASLSCGFPPNIPLRPFIAPGAAPAARPTGVIAAITPNGDIPPGNAGAAAGGTAGTARDSCAAAGQGTGADAGGGALSGFLFLRKLFFAAPITAVPAEAVGTPPSPARAAALWAHGSLPTPRALATDLPLAPSSESVAIPAAAVAAVSASLPATARIRL